MSKMIQEDSIVQIRLGVDVTQLNITAQEGFILSRIHNKSTVKEVYQVSLLNREATATIIKRLVDQGVLLITNPEENKAKEQSSEAQRDYGGFIFNPAEIQEDVEITMEEKKEILFLYSKLDECTYYELLDVSTLATVDEIKKAFVRLSRRFHPDNYFRKQLGSYKSKLNKIYNALGVAHSTLTDSSERREYRKQLIEEGRLTPDETDLEEDPEARKRRIHQERKESRVKHNPMMARVEKGREFFEAGMADIEKQAWLSASTNFKLAITYDPYNELYKAKADQVKDLANKATAERLFQRGSVLESYGQDGYFEAYIKAADTYPSGSEFNAKVARMYVDQNDLDKAVPYAKRAVQSDPQDMEFRLLLGQILLKLRKKNEAVEQFEAVLKRDPENAQAKALYKEAKKWF